MRQLVTSGIASDSGTVSDQGARDQWFDDELINNRNASAELTENMYAPCKDEEPVCCEVVNCFGVGQPELYQNSLRWLSHSH